MLARSLKVTRGRQRRIDGTVVATQIHHPTASTWRYDGVRVLGRTLAKARAILQQTPAVARGALRDGTRRATRQMKRSMAAARPRGPEAADRLRPAYPRLRAMTPATVPHAPHVGAILHAQATPAGKHLAVTVAPMVPLVCQVISQTTRRVLQGEGVPAPETVVRWCEPQTAVIRQGKPGRPTAAQPGASSAPLQASSPPAHGGSRRSLRRQRAVRHDARRQASGVAQARRQIGAPDGLRTATLVPTGAGLASGH
jgi:IS5 family transposase